MSATPHFLLHKEQAVNVGGQLTLVSPAELDQLESQYQVVPIERVLFGFRIPHLPDLMTSPHLYGANERERLAEVLERQTQLVGNLGKWKGVAFALRYLVQPGRGEVEVHVLARVRGEAGRGKQFGETVAADVVASFASTNVSLEPVTTAKELDALLEPLPQSYVFQLRQREERVPLQLSSPAYVVYPFRRPSSTWIHSFEFMLRQRVPCLVSIHLEPTQLDDGERQAFADVSAFAERMSDFMYRGLAGEYRIPDPQARAVAQLHSDYLRRLTNPYLLAVHVASPDQAVAFAIAQALGAEITESAGIDVASREGGLPCGFDLIAPENVEDLSVAHRNLKELSLDRWGKSLDADRHFELEYIPAGKKRLCFLADAKTASAAFRFPVAIRGGIPGIKTRQTLPGHEIGPRSDTVAPGAILFGKFTDRGGVAGAPLQFFTRHTLVAGTTGSGKTTTCIQILSQLWEQGIPFLVIEPANTVYRTLLASPLASSLQIFTLGDESVSPFRLNPLEVMPGVRVEAHISALKACFEAALPTFGILPSLIEESLHNVYRDKDWNLTDKGRVDDKRLMPTLGELYFEIIRATEERGYSQKTLQDIRAAAAGRIGSLLRGSKGRMLNNRRSIPMEALMTRPTILELESLNDDEKALVMLFLLTMIREYCRVNRPESKLQHVTLIEEAHRVMTSVPHASDRETSADTRAQAVEMFSASLSEVRSFGEGLIIAEQIPGHLAQDALKNTNIKIVHRLPGQDDRQAVGATMNLSQEQESFLTKLSPGQAALFIEGYERPTFISVPDYRGQHKLPERMPEDRVEAHMIAFRKDYASLELPFDGCRFCLRQCKYRDRVGPVAYEVESGKRFRKALHSFEKLRSKGDEAAGWAELVKSCRETLEPTELSADEHAAYCYFVHLWSYEATDTMAQRFRQIAAVG